MPYLHATVSFTKLYTFQLNVEAIISLLKEMCELIKECVVLILHTHDGARVGMHCLWHGTAKVRIYILLFQFSH